LCFFLFCFDGCSRYEKDHLDRMFVSLATPPVYTTLRVNTINIELDEALEKINKWMAKEMMKRKVRCLHPTLDNV